MDDGLDVSRVTRTVRLVRLVRLVVPAAWGRVPHCAVVALWCVWLCLAGAVAVIALALAVFLWHFVVGACSVVAAALAVHVASVWFCRLGRTRGRLFWYMGHRPTYETPLGPVQRCGCGCFCWGTTRMKTMAKQQQGQGTDVVPFPPTIERAQTFVVWERSIVALDPRRQLVLSSVAVDET